MSAPVSSTTPEAVAPSAVIDAFDATRRATAQRAAAESRLEPATIYTFTEQQPRASLVGVVGGVTGFVTFVCAVGLTVTTYLPRTHHSDFQLVGFGLAALIVLNLALGYGMTIAHEWLHALLCRLMGGSPAVAPSAPNRVAWSAQAQGFSRASYATVLLGPLVIVAVLWLIILAVAPALAAYLIVAVTLNAAMSGADLWSLVAALRQPERAAVFVDQHPGFIAYAIAAPKPVKKAAPKPNAAKPGKKPGK